MINHLTFASWSFHQKLMPTVLFSEKQNKVNKSSPTALLRYKNNLRERSVSNQLGSFSRPGMTIG